MNFPSYNENTEIALGMVTAATTGVTRVLQIALGTNVDQMVVVVTVGIVHPGKSAALQANASMKAVMIHVQIV